MRRHSPLLAFALLASACSTHPSAAPSVLPLQTLRLYETGVGYFERRGSVPQNDQAGLPIPSGHLDDALKTLVVLSAGSKTHIEGIEFGSRLSNGPARALAGLSKEGSGPITYEELIQSLEGSPVEVKTTHGALSGRLVHVASTAPKEENKDPGETSKAKGTSNSAQIEPGLELSILTTKQEIVRISRTEILSVRPSDPAHAARLDRALESLLAHGAASHHDLRLLGRPGDPVTLGYIAETPVWRTTYRLVGASDPKHATLQAWALVHNDTDEDWRNVRAELVNGRPDSFLFPLAAPRYGRRPLVTPENELSTVPQLSGETADSLWGDHVGESFGSGGLGLSGTGEGGGGRGEGMGLGSIGTIGHGAGTGSESSLLEVGDLAAVDSAKGTESGALFVYRMPNPLALSAHSSALVPFLEQKISSTRIAWLEHPGSSARSGVRIVNDTSQTLPPGTISFFFDGGFSGESSLDRVRSGERRFLTFGEDLDIEATQTVLRADEDTQRLTFESDSLTEHFLRTTRSEWNVENRSGLARSIYVKLGIGRNATISGTDGLDFDIASNRPIMVFSADAHTRKKRDTTSKEGLTRSTRLETASAKTFATIAASPSLTSADKAVAASAAGAMKEVDEVRVKLAATQDELAAIGKERERLREDAKSLGEHGGQERLVARLVGAEDRARAVQSRMEDLKKNEQLRLGAVRAILLKLSRE